MYNSFILPLSKFAHCAILGSPVSKTILFYAGHRRNCKADYNPERDFLTIQLINCPTLEGDIRILFQSHNKSVPKGYEKAPFYFWFNTAFVQDKLILHREDLDNPHKPKTWHCFHENFTIEVSFQSFC